MSNNGFSACRFVLLAAMCVQVADAQEQPSPADGRTVQTMGLEPARPASDEADHAPVIIGCEDDYFIPDPEPPPAVVDKTQEQAASLGRSSVAPPHLSRTTVIKATLGFTVLAILAYLGGHPRLRRLEERLQLTHLVAAGIPFILLGVVASDPRLGILSESILGQIRPMIVFGLGWIGFAVGFSFDIRTLNKLSRPAGGSLVLLTLFPGAAIALVALYVMDATSAAVSDVVVVRDALIVGIAGAISSAPLTAGPTAREGGDWVRAHLEQLAGVGGLLLLASFFRPQGAGAYWQIPGTGWLIMTLGVGALTALVAYLVLARVTSRSAFPVALLGSICFAAGLASFLRLSAVVVCFIAGAALVNAPSNWKEQVGKALVALERPVYFVFLIIAGALWRGTGWEGWLLLLAFVVTRFATKWLGSILLRRQSPSTITSAEQRGMALAPIGALSIAVVLNAQELYSSSNIPMIITAVFGGAMVAEAVIQLALRQGFLRDAEAGSAVQY